MESVSVTGLGYVGLPIAVAFSRVGPVIGYDNDPARIEELCQGHDRTGEVEAAELASANLAFTADPGALRAANFHVVSVPTPVTADNEPDLATLTLACQTLAAVIKPGDTVVFESTVYPGATEEHCVPLLDAGSGLVGGTSYFYGYSPERINPGDRRHRLGDIVKVVAGCDARTRDRIAEVYGRVVPAGICKAASIRVAEAAKVIENTQRDLNIALMNELAMVCERLGLDTGDVLQAAASKWNFMPFSPGLVGGHCIGVDPYYLTHKARSLGYTPRIILAGRSINNEMGEYIAGRVQRLLQQRAPERRAFRVTILGFTFKENVPDTRNTGVYRLYGALSGRGLPVQVHDPLADRLQCRSHYRIGISGYDDLQPADAVILAVPHAEYLAGGWDLMRRLLRGDGGIVFDVKGILDRATRPDGLQLERL